MTTTCKAKSMIYNDLLSFLKNTGCNSIHFDLLRFMGQHPRASFSLYVLSGALGVKSITLYNSIVLLLEQDILIVRTDDYGLVTYSLSTNRETCDCICRLASLDWSNAAVLRKQLENVL